MRHQLGVRSLGSWWRWWHWNLLLLLGGLNVLSLIFLWLNLLLLQWLLLLLLLLLLLQLLLIARSLRLGGEPRLLHGLSRSLGAICLRILLRTRRSPSLAGV